MIDMEARGMRNLNRIDYARRVRELASTGAPAARDAGQKPERKGGRSQRI